MLGRGDKVLWPNPFTPPIESCLLAAVAEMQHVMIIIAF